MPEGLPDLARHEPPWEDHAQVLERATDLVRRLLEPLLRFNLLDRSLALGAQAFVAVIPLLMVIEAAQPGDDSLADELISRFHLKDAAADTVARAFTPPDSSSTTTVLTVLLLLVSVLSFTRRLQRLYEESWGLPPRGLRGTGAGLAWVLALVIYGILHPLLDGLFDGFAAVVLSLSGGFTIALLTPFLLLGRRLPWQQLVGQAGLTAVGMLALGAWSAIYMPRAIASSAASYGTIGVAFAMITWLWGLGVVLVCGAVYGAHLPSVKRSSPAGVSTARAATKR
jgi:membrane protein